MKKMEDDDEDDVSEDDEDDDQDNHHYSQYNIDSKDDEYLGIHVVGQRLSLGTPSTPSSSKSVNQSGNQSINQSIKQPINCLSVLLDLKNVSFIIIIPNTWLFQSSVNQSV